MSSLPARRNLREIKQKILRHLGLRRPVVPQELGMAAFQQKSFYKLHPDTCPCDIHLVEYLAKNEILGRSVFHFGTGAHHLVGLENAKLLTPNDILGITAAAPEHAAYVDMVIATPALAKSYKVLFADVYTLQEALLPEFDLVTLFHLCEFYMPERSGEVLHDDASLLQMFLRRLRPGGRIIFYRGSFAWEKARLIVENAGLEPVEEYQDLLIYRKRGSQ